MKNRLYLKLYAALLASAFVCLTVAGVAFRLWSRAGGLPVERLQSAADAVVEQVLALPPVEAAGRDARTNDVRDRLSRISSEFAVDLMVGNQQGPRIGIPSVRAFVWPADLGPGWRRERGGPLLVVELQDGSVAVLHARGPYRRLRLHPFFATLMVLAVVMALGSYPVARRLARRLESLAEAMDRWGRGDLDHRVAVSAGRDEMTVLATTFNQAAERVSVLLTQQKQMLANASHELRSPLARLRMGLELIAEEPDGDRRRERVGEIHRDIVELDELIEEILLFARADARVPGRPLVPVDLLGLSAEEASRTGARFENQCPEGSMTVLAGDPTLLRHMIRNLLENAQHHGGAQDVRIILRESAGAGARDQVETELDTRADAVDGPPHQALIIGVEDAGPGIPPSERERIFAPFYRQPAPQPSSSGGQGGRAPGHGVGLALVRQVARYHGGTVTYRPRDGGGSAFEVRLPITPAASATR